MSDNSKKQEANIVMDSLKYLRKIHDTWDSKIEKPIQECEDMVPSFNFKIYKIDIERSLQKKYSRRKGYD